MSIVNCRTCDRPRFDWQPSHYCENAMTEFAIFNDESADWSSEESVEAGFYSRAEAEDAIRTRYSPDDGLVIHAVEEPEEDDEDECQTCGEFVCECDDEADSESYPIKY